MARPCAQPGKVALERALSTVLALCDLSYDAIDPGGYVTY